MTMTGEVITDKVTIEGIDEDNVPACEMRVSLRNLKKCGKPSAYRVLPRCGDCGWQQPKFMCEGCHEKLKQGRFWCGKHHPRGFFITWSYL